MKKIYIFITVLVLFCSGCAEKYPIMPAIKYDKQIDFNIKNKAYLYWMEGKQHRSAVIINRHSGTDNLVGALGDYFSTKSEVPKTNFYSAYGKAEQIIFITSLRDLLVNNQVFSSVDIITSPKQITNTFPLITINFKATKQSTDKITLTVELDIEYAKSHFKRVYLVESTPELSSVRLQQISVSEKLMQKIISGLKEWKSIKEGKK